tara:strand:- start:7206 stop:7439 length:234 start_codon:yes stop_codon:yes gene_type:complete
MRKYVIINTSEVSGVDFNQVIEQSADDLRYSVDGSKAVVKFEGDAPSFLIGETQYTWSEIIDVLNTSEWTTPEEAPV